MRKTKEITEFGNFQTPTELAQKVCEIVVLRPTFAASLTATLRECADTLCSSGGKYARKCPSLLRETKKRRVQEV